MMEMCRVVVLLSCWRLCPVTGVFTRVVCTPRPWNETTGVNLGQRTTTICLHLNGNKSDFQTAAVVSTLNAYRDGCVGSVLAAGGNRKTGARKKRP
jgi:hypothetical protein